MIIRDYEPADLLHLYEICLQTGNHGSDATATCSHPRLLGDYFAAPYAVRDPELCLILADATGPCGYILGTADTVAFASWFNQQWLPAMRERYRTLRVATRASDAWLIAQMRDDQMIPDCAKTHPAHLHIDILPRAQRAGWGRQLFVAWTIRVAQRGAPGVHLGVAKGNPNAVAFYERLGMHRLGDAGGAWMYGLALDPPGRTP